MYKKFYPQKIEVAVDKIILPQEKSNGKLVCLFVFIVLITLLLFKSLVYSLEENFDNQPVVLLNGKNNNNLNENLNNLIIQLDRWSDLNPKHFPKIINLMISEETPLDYQQLQFVQKIIMENLKEHKITKNLPNGKNKA
ncbi:hypothetical protein PPERSA_10006 [Pseudocohnilembus persalinus]|uniref:Uncharacterized protein n=1 Tax=Pseudocohnilembus persalinus TaxID=266149 RepID=A0A0V0QK62_PSEPJ|nr:hypothetical protein PPERSA_10006 [Pseudocohnilembus persalinus]|eukprot:KRX02389.1 hypothetical protein PPERSA_10006 [Pseudocohnilembus persalinus]